MIMDNHAVWKNACVNDLRLPVDHPLPQNTFNWFQIYQTTFNGDHTFTFRDKERYMSVLRIGAYLVESGVLVLSDILSHREGMPSEEDIENLLDAGLEIKKIKNGIWIADLLKVKCPICHPHPCVDHQPQHYLDVRHVELLLFDDYKNGTWQYDELAALRDDENEEGVARASAAIFDIEHVQDASSIGKDQIS
uniref:Uncharacterized protein n=1 Tax=Fagus sylvatica TaxID=28930 RepID=A0A2N9HCE2_FAGSY